MLAHPVTQPRKDENDSENRLSLRYTLTECVVNQVYTLDDESQQFFFFFKKKSMNF